jgi:cell division transport system permease protein
MATVGDRVGKPGRHSLLGGLLLNHLRTLIATLGVFYRTPFSSLMTSAVLGIALALPAGLYLILQNVQQLGAGWDGTARISLFIQRSLADEQAAKLADRLQQWPEIARVTFKTRDEALEEFRRYSGFGGALRALKGNPLPAVIIIQPTRQFSKPRAIAKLLGKLQAMPQTERAQLDLQWVKRLFSIMEIGERAVYVIAGLLALAVLLIIGNTIRLDIQNRRDEIIITKLIGATNAFIRRPFLYSGFWYGIVGGLLAWLMVGIAIRLLAGPVNHLSTLYASKYTLSGLGLAPSLVLLGSAALLGLIGSWLAVRRHLNAIEPT